MDTSEQYIKMCEKAEEIQKGWQPDEGDVVAHLGNIYYIGSLYHKKRRQFIDINMYEACSAELPFNEYITDPLWLPRQDQLQEMTGLKVAPLIIRIYDFWDGHSHEPYAYTSMEQLWLAFVYKENHNKIWDGENWVKEGG